MTRRARWTRPFVALFALWFAVVLGDPGLLHSCPMHGGHGGAHSAASAGDAQMMHEAGAMQHVGQQGAPHHGKAGPCTCVGQCCAVSAIALVPVVAAMHVPTTISRAEQPLVVALEPAGAAPDTRLPFPNGPPIA